MFWFLGGECVEFKVFINILSEILSGYLRCIVLERSVFIKWKLYSCYLFVYR